MTWQLGFSDLSERLEQLEKQGDPLARLAEVVDFEMFRAQVGRIWENPGGFQESCRMKSFQAAAVSGVAAWPVEGSCVGLSRTVAWRSQRRVLPVQRSGWRALAAA